MHGFYGRVLKIDLSEDKYSIEAVRDEILEKYLGGKGLSSYLLYELNPPGVDPLDPANCLVFATGPVTGSAIWGSSRYGVFTKSPQTGFYSESYSGGKVPEAIDSTGFDAIVIQGQSDEPTVLAIQKTWGQPLTCDTCCTYWTGLGSDHRGYNMKNAELFRNGQSKTEVFRGK